MRIKIDSSKITGVIAGSALLDKKNNDVWFYKDVELASGKIYGLVSEYDQGCMYLSYLLGGKIPFGNLQVFIDGNSVMEDNLKEISWNLEPLNEKYARKTVKKAIENALKKNLCTDTFEDITREFLLTEPRYDRQLRHLSGEHWRASAALGYANGKRIFYAPYNCSLFYHQMDLSHLFDALRFLANKGAIVLLPVGSDLFIKSVVDECIYSDWGFQ